MPKLYAVIDKLADSTEFVDQVYDMIITFDPDLSFHNPVADIEHRVVPSAVRVLKTYMCQTEFSLKGGL